MSALPDVKTKPDRPVLFIANNFPPVRGGSAVVYANLARCAEGRIIVLAPRIGYADGLQAIGWREHDRHAPYRVIRLPLLRTVFGPASPSWPTRARALAMDALIRARIVWTVLGLIASQGVRTICIGELITSGWIVSLIRLVPGLRSIAYVHGEEITTDDGYDRDHARGRRALLAADAIVVVSRFTRSAVERLIGPEAAARITLIENGVDTERFSPGPRSDSLLDLYGLRGCFVFVSVCRLLEKKGIDTTIRAFAAIAAAHPATRYLVVGSGPYEATLRALAAGEGVADRVVFAGSVAEGELVEHYRLGDVFIMPNRALPDGDTEGFGLVFLEANACGLPVIAGRDGGSTDAVEDGVNGLVVNGVSQAEVERAMLWLMSDGGELKLLQERGLAHAFARSWHLKTKTFVALCRETIDANTIILGPGRT